MKLVLPSSQYRDSFISAVKEFYSDTEGRDRGQYYKSLDINWLNENFKKYVEEVCSQAAGKNLPEGYVPQSVYWLVNGDQFVGMVSIRHELTDFLLRVGGHVGYDIRPTERKKGYGKKILELALNKCDELGIVEVLVTCDENNIGSKKIIEANGGVLENIVEIGNGKPRKLRYWINR